MADTCGSDGIYGRIATDTTSTADISNFTSADLAWPVAGTLGLKFEQPHVNPTVQNGSGAECSETTRKGLKIVQGDIPLLLTPDVLDFWVPYVTGMAYSTGVSYVTNAAGGNLHVLSHMDAKTALFSFINVNTMTIDSQSGQPITMTLGCFGKSRTFETATWPTGLDVSNDVPYMHHDAVVEIDGTEYEFRQWKIVHTRNIGPRYFGSDTPCGFKKNGNRTTTLQLVGPFTATTIADILQAGTTAADVVITLTHPTAGVSCEFQMQGVQFPETFDPPVGQGEILLDVTGACRTVDGGASGGAELIITNDSTPT